jgi:hypothetical protein
LRWGKVVERLSKIAHSDKPVGRDALPYAYADFFGSMIHSPPVPQWMLFDEFVRVRLNDQGTDCRPLARALLNMFSYVLASQAIRPYESRAQTGRDSAAKRRKEGNNIGTRVEAWEHEYHDLSPKSPREDIAQFIRSCPRTVNGKVRYYSEVSVRNFLKLRASRAKSF